MTSPQFLKFSPIAMEILTLLLYACTHTRTHSHLELRTLAVHIHIAFDSLDGGIEVSLKQLKLAMG